MTDLSALPAVPAAALPADLRSAPRADQQAYRAALGFERVLLGELVQSMSRATAAAGDSAAERGPYASMSDDALADALVVNGGLGLAGELFRALRGDAARTASGSDA